MAKLIALVIILSLGIFPSSLASAEGATTVSVSAPTEVDAGKQFTISIAVEPGTEIAGAQFDLSFDQSLVTANSVTEGNLLSENGAATYFNPGAIYNTTGTISGVAGAIIIPGQTVSVSGTFATITLTAGTTRGTCPLTLSGVVVGDANGQSVSVSVVSSQITIHGQGTTNQPPILSPIGNRSVNEGELLEFTISATDSDDDPLTFSASNLPPGSDFNEQTRTFSWTPTSSQVGSYPDVYFEVSDGEQTDFENITITVNTPTPPAGSGGGGAPPGTTFFHDKVDPEGYFLQEASAWSADNLVKITILEGVKGLDAYGNPLTYVTIVEMEEPPYPTSDQTVIGPIYDFGPDGATFNPPINLTITYNPALIPEGVNEEDLAIVVWDTSIMIWTKSPSVVDTENHTISAQIHSFSSYTIMTLPPEVTTGIAIATGNHSATLNGYLIDLGTASSVEVCFEWGSEPGRPYPNNTASQFMSTTGDFSFTLNDLEVETTYYFRAIAVGVGVVYSEEASFALPAFPAIFTTGDASDITENSATLHALLEDLGTIRSVQVSFEWGENQGGPYPNRTQSEQINTGMDYCYTLADLEPGKAYYYRVLVQSVGTVYSNEKSFDTPACPVPQSPSPAAFFADKLMIFPKVATIGEPITISLELSNIGGREGSYTVTLAINNTIEEARDIALATGESQTVSFTVNKVTSGIYEVAIDDRQGTFEILPRPSSTNWLLIGGVVTVIVIPVTALLKKLVN
ncbi:MAG: hypothetical protein JSV77_04410 [Dehalococcoidales bacterium]|nr:MAG: hypothetical protein JSV77_04410 [Dehalococcoidales bacterium]